MRKAALLIALVFLFKFISAQNTSEISLNDNWQFRKSGDTAWLRAIVPGCVHTDLLAHNLIPDPFYANNEKDVQWIENEDWEYMTTFILDKKTVKQKHIEIKFEGLDTYADVYLNDSLILQADDMFSEWHTDIRKYLHTGENILYIKFTSAIKKGKELMDKYPVSLPGGERGFTRKAQYQYGWDWGPRLVTCGIWKKVAIIAGEPADILITGARLSTYAADTAKVYLSVFNRLNKNKKYRIQVRNTENNKIYYHKKTELYYETNAIEFNIDSPKLWWCNSMGDPYTYKLEVTVAKGIKHILTTDKHIALRDVKLIENNDSPGKSFYFELNGLALFAKGANVIPLNSFPTSLKKEDYRNLLYEAAEMNMNMLRVWGGGVYEDDYFYDLCDSLGILVWQDYMFAGAMYPMDTNELTLKSELADQYTRLKYHPCIALFCGNNEIDEGWNNWGWQEQFKYSLRDSTFIYDEYKTWFNTFIPSEMELFNNFIPYHPSSPSFGWGHPESLTEGDCHYWGVWWGHEPFEIYNEKIPRFMSEYGFQGMPSYNSFKQFIPQNELQGSSQQILNNPSVRNHQKHTIGYETINEYMAGDYKVPTDFEDYIYVSQLLQARGMQIAIEAHRRNMPYCMGTLFWQLNDCWPVTSWSVIDYYGNRKAAYYTVKEKYKDVMLSVLRENDQIKLYIVNNSPYSLDITLKTGLINTVNPVFGTSSIPFTIPGNTPKLAATYSIDKLNGAIDSSHCILYNAVLSGDSLLTEDFYDMQKPKDMQFALPYIELSFDSTANDLLLTSDYYAEKVYLYSDDNELNLDDNFFFLLPGEQKRIHIVNFNADMVSEIKLKTLNTINLQY